MDRLGVYIHIPFCARKCPYCDFYSTKYNKETVSLYVDSIIRNFRAFSLENGKKEIVSVYFGGGTPILLSPSQFYLLLSSLSECFSFSEDIEITTEANPSMSDKNRFSEYRKTGLNRISFGVQSFNETELKSLQRTHTAEGAIRAIENAYSAGFDNISADIMLGIPHQTKESLSSTLETAGDLPLSHISAYMLKIEEGTPFDSDEIIKTLPDDDTTAELYLHTIETLEKKGFLQYEISNFAKKGRQSRHNLLYWESADYIGFGAAAHSCYLGSRFAVPSDIASFTENSIQGKIITDENPCDFSEYAMLRLRLTEGLSLKEAEKRFSFDKETILHRAEKFRKAGLVNVSDDVISLTKNGFLVSNGIISDLVL